MDWLSRVLQAMPVAWFGPAERGASFVDLESCVQSETARPGSCVQCEMRPVASWSTTDCHC